MFRVGLELEDPAGFMDLCDLLVEWVSLPCCSGKSVFGDGFAFISPGLALL